MNEIQFSRIVVPTDFSELATGALALAQEIAKRSDGELDVIYADPFLPPPHFTSAQIASVAEELRESKSLAVDELERYVADHVDSNIRARARVIESLAVPAIVDYAEKHAADLIVMGTHGRSGINRVMLGSVTERVLRETSIPLLTTRSSAGDTGAIRSILCPVNFTGAAEDALRHANELARVLSATLIVAHVADDDREEGEEIASIDRCVIGAGAKPAEVERVVLHGDADEAVVRYVRENEIDLVVLAATHRRFFDTTVLGSTTVHVIRHAPVPVLTVTSRPPS